MSLGTKLSLVIFFLTVVACLTCTAFVAAASEEEVARHESENRALASLRGNWSISWLNGRWPQQTRFVLTVADDNFLLREESPGVLEEMAESWLRSSWMVWGEKSLRKSACSLGSLRVGSRQRVRNARVSAEGIHPLDCAEADPLPLPQHQMNGAFGTVLTEPQAVYLLSDDVCTPAPFTMRGYWMEWVKKHELLLVLMLREGAEDCSAVFQLSRLSLEEETSYSIVGPSLLLAVALIKYFPRIFLRKQRRSVAAGGDVFLNADRHVLSRARRNELLQEQERIIRLMKQQDGRL